jgi:hypothetical protein
MIYIGTSLGKCLRSLLLGEVDEKDVLVIIARTKAPDLRKFHGVVKKYYDDAEKYSSVSPGAYDINVKPLVEVIDLATRLYIDGKIHQPRLFVFGNDYFFHPELAQDIWIELSPKNRNTTPAVKQAYEHYKMLDLLTK